MKREELIEEFGQSKDGNFIPEATHRHPHLYCITPKHLSTGRMHLDEDAIIEAEEKGAKCGVVGCNLSFKEHEEILLVKCKKDFHKDKSAQEEIQTFLESIKEKMIAKNLVGVGFIKAFD